MTETVLVSKEGGGAIEPDLVWSVDDLTVAGVMWKDGTLSVTGRGVGGTRAHARYFDQDIAVDIQVSEAEITGLGLSAASVILPVGLDRPFQIFARYSDGSQVDVTAQITWLVENESVARIEDGVVVAVSPGVTLVHATYMDDTVTFTVTITEATLDEITLDPGSATTPIGLDVRFAALGRYSDGRLLDVSDEVTWSSDDMAIAVVERGVAVGVLAGTTKIRASIGEVSATADLVISGDTVIAMYISPSGPVIPAGHLEQLRAIALLSDGRVTDVTDQVAWQTITNNAVIDGRGVIRGVVIGTVEVRATLGEVQARRGSPRAGIQASTFVTISSATLQRIDVTPSPLTLAPGTSGAVAATGIYSDGVARDVALDVTWASDAPEVATVANGVVEAAQAGIARVSASASGRTGTATVVVSNAQLVSIAVTAPQSALPLGATEQLTATATYSDGSTQNVTSAATWSTDHADRVTVSNSAPRGTATAVAAGPAMITASIGTVSGSQIVTAVAARLDRVEIDPTTLTLAAGGSHTARATAVYTDGTTVDVSTQVLWSSSAPEIATVSNGPQLFGVVLARAPGTTTITAQLGNETAALALRVTSATVVSLTVSPSNLNVPLGTTAPLHATASYSDGSNANVTSQVVWSSSAPAVAAVSNAQGAQGRVTGQATGAATITASIGGVASTAAVAVTTAQLLQIQLTPPVLNLPPLSSGTLVATGVYSDGTTHDITAQIAWSTSAPLIASVNAGRVNTGAPGTATITAALSGVSATVTVNVLAAALVSLSISAQPPLVPGQSSQLTATGTYDDGSIAVLTTQAAWSSSSPQVATVSNALTSHGVLTGLTAGTTTITAQVGLVSASATVTVSAATLTGIQVSPTNVTLPAGLTSQLIATGLYSDGSTRDLTAQANWTSSAPLVASVSSAGVVSARTAGSAAITAQVGAFVAQAHITATAATLRQLQVSPASVSLPLGLTQQLTATAIFSDGSHANVTSSVAWTSDATSIATVANVSGAAGLVSVHATGSATITAQLGTQTATAEVTVTAAALTEIQLTPTTLTLPAGTTASIIATGVYSDGSSHDVTNQVGWTSDAPAVAGVNAGHITAAAAGTAAITADFENISATATVTVTAATLASLSVTPATPNIVVGGTVQLTATGTFSDGSTANVTTQVTWSSSSTAVASVSNATGSQGLVAGSAAGTATITAQLNGTSATATVAVSSAVITNLQIAPTPMSLPAGLTGQLTATGAFSDGASRDVTAQATWTSSDPSIASVSSTGLVSASAPGSVTIIATAGGFTAQAAVTVTPGTIQQLQISPASFSFPVGNAHQLTANALYTDGSHADVTTSVTWTSNATAIATVSNAPGTQGQITGQAAGTATITAELNELSSSATVTVTNTNLVEIQLTPAVLTLPAGTTADVVATGIYGDGTSYDITGQVAWSSSTPAAATVDTGHVTAVAVGTTTLTAQLGGVSATAAVNVTNALLVSIAVTPSQPTLVVLQPLQLTATGTYSDGSTVNLTSQVTWTTSNPLVATISNAAGTRGLAIGLLPGTATATATLGGSSGNTVVTVSAAVLTSLTVSPAALSVPSGVSSPLTATGTFSDGSSRDMTTQVAWMSSDPSVASVSAAGSVTGGTPGSATITATAGLVTAQSSVTVTAATLSSLQIAPAVVGIPLGTSQQLTATGIYSDGSHADVTSAVTWTSSLTSVATVSNVSGSNGKVTSQSLGNATIAAQLGAISATAAVTVTNATLAQIQLTPASLSLPAGTTSSLVATGVYSDTTTRDITAQVTWTSSAPGIAAVNAGQITAGVPGTATISAQLGSVTGTSEITVTDAVIVGLAVTPPTASIPLLGTFQLTATATYSDGSSRNATSEATWLSDNVLIASVSNTSDARGKVSALLPGDATITAQLGGFSAGSTVTATLAALVSLQATPPTLALPVGLSAPITVRGTYSDGSSQDLTTQASWSSDAPASASVSSAGVVSANAVGNATITASVGAIFTQISVTATPATLQQLQVSPAALNLPLGVSGQLAATGIYSDGSHADATASVTWTSSDAAVATVSNVAESAGQVASQGTGSATITATLGGVTATTAVTVTPAELQQLQIDPVVLSLPAGTTGSLTAMALYTDGTQHDLTTQVGWISSDPMVAGVNAGQITAVAAGTSTITVQLGNTMATAAVTVTAAQLIEIQLTPATLSLPAGTSATVNAMGVYSDTTTHDLTATATWSSDAPLVASVAAGRVTAGTPGSATITAQVGTTTAALPVTVTNAVLTGIAIAPAVPTVASGRTAQLTATATYSDGSTGNITSQVTWTSSNLATAVVSNVLGTEGLLAGLVPGTASITAQIGDVSATVTATVSSAVLVSVQVQPVTVALPVGLSGPITAIGTLSDGLPIDLSAQAVYSTSDPTVATVSSNGLITAQGAGTTTITVNTGGVSANVGVTVVGATLQSIQVSPATTSVPLGNTQQFTATGTYSDGTPLDITAAVTWTSSDTAVAPVSNLVLFNGQATSRAVGTATITAALAGKTGTATLTATSATLSEIQMTPATLVLPDGTSGSINATGVYSDGTTRSLTSQVSWSSSAPLVASVQDGVVTAVEPGTATITAQLGTTTATTAVVVSSAVLTDLAIDQLNPTTVLGQSTQLTATATYSDGSSVNATNQVLWTSSDPLVAVVSIVPGTQGRVTPIGTGTTQISATIGTTTATTTLTVSGATLAEVHITPATVTLPRGLSVPLAIVGTYTDGTNLDLSAEAVWSSSVPATASVSTTGLVSANAAGTTDVTATAAGMTAHATVNVTAAIPSTLQVAPLLVALPLGVSTQMTATAFYSDGTHNDVTGAVTWTSSVPSVATVSNVSGSAGKVTSQALGATTITGTLGALTATAALTATPSTLSEIQLTPSTLTMPSGVATQVSATGVYSDGTTHDLTAQAAWTSSAPSTASVLLGRVTAGAAGSATITAKIGSVATTLPVTVSQAVLGQIAIDPPTPTVAAGQTTQLTATGTYSDNSTANITANVLWTSSNPLVAAVSNLPGSQGRVVALTPGTTTITAALDGATTSVTLTVSAAVLASLQIAPVAVALPTGLSTQLSATGLLTDGTSADLSSQVTWSSAAPTTASVSTTGLLSANATGTTTVSAALGGVTTNVNVAVTAAVLQQIQISPTSLNLPLGVGGQLTATGIYSDGSHADATASVTWTSSAPSVGTVSNLAGLAGTVATTALGDSTVTASLGNVSSTANLHVAPATLTSVSVLNPGGPLPLGLTAQLQAFGTYTDGTTVDLTNQATWASSTAAVNVSNATGTRGVVLGAALGQSAVSATVGGVTGETVVDTTAAALQSITVSAASALPLGLSTQLTATGNYSDGSTVDLTNQVTWSSSAPAVASVTHGLVTSLGLGDAQVTASLGGVNASTTITSSPATLTSIQVTPSSASIAAGLGVALTAIGTYSDNSTLLITNQVTWTSDAPTRATVNNTGLIHGIATGVSPGTAHITATLGSVNASATVVVVNALLLSVTLAPASAAIALGQVQTYAATANYSDGTTISVTSAANWSSTNSSVATVSNVAGTKGTATALALGTTTLSATFSGVTGTASLSVNAGCHVVINEVKTGTLLDSRDEFIELFNPCSFAIDLSRSRLAYRSILGLVDLQLLDLSGSIAPGGYKVYGGPSYGGTSNGTLFTDLASIGGGIALRDITSNAIQDSMGYGTAVNLFIEGIVSVALPTGNSLSRIPNGKDTDNNSVDFIVTNPPTPGAANQ